jgi:hypothetical protein
MNNSIHFFIKKKYIFISFKWYALDDDLSIVI